MAADGKITITDRKKDMILVSGFNVYPNEVESVIASMPGVLECGVVGVPHERSGETVKGCYRIKRPLYHQRRCREILPYTINGLQDSATNYLC